MWRQGQLELDWFISHQYSQILQYSHWGISYTYYKDCSVYSICSIKSMVPCINWIYINCQSLYINCHFLSIVTLFQLSYCINGSVKSTKPNMGWIYNSIINCHSTPTVALYQMSFQSFYINCHSISTVTLFQLSCHINYSIKSTEPYTVWTGLIPTVILNQQ